jgi:PilZ domain
MRSSVRFPLELPVEVHAHRQCFEAMTKDISAGGVLFYMDTDIEVGSIIEFSISMPAQIIGAETDIMVKCVGRVVRSQPEGERCAVAAVIDEYTFER